MEKRIVASPTIWNKDNTKISVYSDEETSGKHKEPHLHVKHGQKDNAVIRIKDGALLEGKLPSKILKWCRDVFLNLFAEKIMNMIKTKNFFRIDRILKSDSKKKSHIEDDEMVTAGNIEEWESRHIVTAVQISTYVLRIMFRDGSIKDIDLEPVINRDFYRPLFQPMIDDPSIVSKFKVDATGMDIFWDDIMDFSAEWLYEHGADVL